jgi:hypothetical protein
MASKAGEIRGAVSPEWSGDCANQMRDFNIDLQCRDRSAAIDPHAHVFALDRDLPGYCR